MIDRHEYERSALDESQIHADPMVQFGLWLDDAIASNDIDEPFAMTLATATNDAAPSARVVLLRGFDERGFVFFTNYESRKGNELNDNPRAALVLFWSQLERQVRVEGIAERVTDEESDAYFDSRPRSSRLGALVSKQSRVVTSRAEMESRMADLEREFPDETDVPRPDNWGGYRVKPSVIEFWQGRRNRLHDRLRYTRSGGSWHIERLAP